MFAWVGLKHAGDEPRLDQMSDMAEEMTAVRRRARWMRGGLVAMGGFDRRGRLGRKKVSACEDGFRFFSKLTLRVPRRCLAWAPDQATLAAIGLNLDAAHEIGATLFSRVHG